MACIIQVSLYISIGSIWPQMVVEHNRRTTWTCPLRMSGSGWRSVGIGWEDMILPGVEHPRNLGQSEWDQKLGKIECVFSLYDKMRWKWDDVYLLQGVPNIASPSLCPPPLPLNLCTAPLLHEDVLGRRNQACLEMHLETEIEWSQRCTWMLLLSVLGDTLGGHDQSRLEEYLESVDLEAIDLRGVNLEAVDQEACAMEAETLLIGQLVINRRTWSCELGGPDRVSLEMHLEAMINRDWRSTWRWLIWRRLNWRWSIWRQSIWRERIWRR